MTGLAARPGLVAPTVPLEADRSDDWPRTGRLLPWLLAAFVAMLWLIPFDAIDLPFQLPADAKPDRILLGGIFLIWLASLAAGGTSSPTLRSAPVVLGVMLFFAVAALSLFVNLQQLVNLDETAAAVKKVALLGSYVLFFLVVATSVRPTEARRFVYLVCGLAAITALGTIYEYRSDSNPFYSISADLAPPGVDVEAAPSGQDTSDRERVRGPTGHGLAVSTMFALVVPFALLAFTGTRDVRAKVMWLALTGLLLAGSLATTRKSSVVVPLASLAILLFYAPARFVRLLPVLAVLVALVPLISPGALDRVTSQFNDNIGESSSVRARTEDYDALQTDLVTNPVLGRGFGTYDPIRFRILDNQYLGLAVETGFVGVTAYLIMIGLLLATTHPVIRRGPPDAAWVSLGIAAGAVGFAIATVLFDVLGFPHAPYLFLFLAGLAVAVRAQPLSGPRPA